MAIDHFDVPAIYLVDLTRLLPTAHAVLRAETTARLWRCLRPLTTAVALAAAFLPRWTRGLAYTSPGPPAAAVRVLAGYGTTSALPRPEQLVRKVMHFDSLVDTIRYLAVQSRRIAMDRIERRVRGRSARQRLGL
jgi:hypothetical protein